MRKMMLLGVMVLWSLGAAAALDAFRVHRYDVLKSIPVNRESIVFLGNSITNMQPWTEAFGSDPRIINRGTGGAYSADLLDNVRTVCVGQPAKLFLMIGVNDLVSLKSPDEIAENIRSTVEIVRSVSPRTQIFVQSILPTVYSDRVEETNTCIRAVLEQFNASHIAEANPAIYIDVYTALQPLLSQTTPSGIGYFTDGLHLSAASYKIWMDMLSAYVGLPCVYPDETAELQYNGGFGKADAHGARATSLDLLPISSDDVLFFGDEMVSSGEWHELLRNPHVKNRGTGWKYETTDIPGIPRTNKYIDATFIEKEGVVKFSPKQVIVYTGTAEVNGTGAVSSVLYSYSIMVNKIRNYVGPNTKICMVSLMPSTMVSAERVEEFNAGLSDYASQHDNLEYIDIYSALTEDGAQKPGYFTDNLLMGCGYIEVARILAEHIEDCTPLTPQESADYRADVEGRLKEGWYQIRVGSGDGPDGLHKANEGKYLCGNRHGFLRQKWGVGLTTEASDPTTCVYVSHADNGNYYLQFHSSPENIYYANYRSQPVENPDEIALIPNSDFSEWKILGRGEFPWTCYNHVPVAVAGQKADEKNSDCYFRIIPVSNVLRSPLDGSVDAECADCFVQPRYASAEVTSQAIYYVDSIGRFVSYATGEPVACSYTLPDMVAATQLPVSFSPFSKGYATLYSPQPLRVEGGLKAYVATEVNERGRLRMKTIEDDVIPARTGVLLLGEPATTIMLPICEEELELQGEEQTWGTAQCILKGNLVNTPSQKGDCIFSLARAREGFYRVADGFTIQAFQAYYAPQQMIGQLAYALDFKQTASEESLTSAFAEQTTGVEPLPFSHEEQGSALAEVYDLQGRRVGSAMLRSAKGGRGILIGNSTLHIYKECSK